MIRLRLVTHVGAGSPLQRFVVGSLVAHLIFVVGVILVPMLRPRPPMSDEFMTVILEPAGPGPAESAVTAPADPQPQEPPEGVVAQPEEPPKPKPQKKPPKKTQKPPAPPPPPAAQPPTTDSGDASGDGQGPDVGIAGLEGDEFAWYRLRVKNAIQVKWRRPFLQGVREPTAVGVVFVIQRDGSVTGLAVDTPSGIDVLDRSALRAVYEATLPALPRNWGEPTADARFLFRLFPDEF